MISKSEKANENYLAKIILVKDLEPVDGLDNLVRLTVDRRPILTSKNTTEGTIAIYFPSGSKLSPEYLSKNNEFKASTGLNADRLHKGGFFEEKGRVKPVKFKGNMSDGYVAPIETLEPLVGPKYKELADRIGEEFDSVGDLILLEKYIAKEVKGPTPPSGRDKSLKKYSSRVIEKQFKFHYDTTHLDKNLHRLEPEDLISISWKLHGTSFISSKVLCKRQPAWFERLSAWLGRIFTGLDESTYTEYANLYASRKVIKNEDLNPNAQHYYGTDIYELVNEAIKDKLFAGESVYGEIVGFTPDGKPLQGKYDYGCQPKQHKAYVYRITYTGFDGNTVDLPFKLMAERCKELDILHVPLVFQGRARDLVEFQDKDIEKLSGVSKADTLEEWRERFYTFLKTNYVRDQNSAFCANKVPEEGVVVRREGLAPFALKFVSDAYKLGESKAKDLGVVDTEEEQDA